MGSVKVAPKAVAVTTPAVAPKPAPAARAAPPPPAPRQALAAGTSFEPKPRPDYARMLGTALPTTTPTQMPMRGETPTPRQTPTQAGGVTQASGSSLPPDMPRVDPSRVTIHGGTVADVEAQLAYLWLNGGPGGQEAVRAFVNEVNNGGDTVNFGADTGGAYMQAGPGVLNLPSTSLPGDRNGQVRWMMSFVHEMQHFTQDWAYAGSTYGEQRAYIAGYDFMADSLGLSNTEIRDILGGADPTYFLGTMVREYGIDPGSNSFLEFMRNVGVGTGLGSLRDIAGSNHGSRSSSPLDQTGDGLDMEELWDIAADIANGEADIRHLNDDPSSVDG